MYQLPSLPLKLGSLVTLLPQTNAAHPSDVSSLESQGGSSKLFLCVTQNFVSPYGTNAQLGNSSDQVRQVA